MADAPFIPFEHAAVPTPKQNRSEATLTRILRAAQDLLEEHTFNELSVQLVVKRAKCSVGTFYGRFADKEALLDSLDEIYARDLVRDFQEIAEEWSLRSLTLPALVGEASRFLVAFPRQRRGVVRALILHARLHPAGSFGDRTRRMVGGTPEIVRVFLGYADSIRHPNPRRAARFAMVQALTTVREYVLFPEGPASAEPLSDDDTAHEVARSWYHYLTGGDISP